MLRHNMYVPGTGSSINTNPDEADPVLSGNPTALGWLLKVLVPPISGHASPPILQRTFVTVAIRRKPPILVGRDWTG